MKGPASKVGKVKCRHQKVVLQNEEQVHEEASFSWESITKE